MPELDYKNNTMTLKSEYKYVDICRALPNRKWDKFNKVWVIPIEDFRIVTTAFSEVQLNVTPKLIEKQIEETARKIDLQKMSSQEHTDEVIQFGEDLKLMPFQAVGVQFLEKANGVAMIADEAGCGKSIQTLAYLRRHPDLRPALIIAPATVKINWEREAEKWLDSSDTTHVINSNGKKNKELPEASIYIINYDILAKHLDFLSTNNFKVMVADESHYCFPYKTKILTDEGEIEIGDIVENKLDASIACYDVKKAKINYRPITHYFKNPNTYNTIELKHEHGKLECTPNHKIWTTEGYKKAEKIYQKKDRTKMRLLWYDISNPKKRGSNGSILFTNMHCKSCEQQTRSKRNDTKEVHKTTYRKRMCMVQNTLQNTFMWGGITTKKILFKIMFCSLAYVITPFQRTITENSDNISIKMESWKKEPKSINTNETEQSYVQSRICKKNEGDTKTNRTSPHNSWGKWANNQTTKNIINSTKSPDGTYNHNTKRNPTSIFSKISDMVQHRCGRCETQSSDRNRWDVTSLKKATTERQTEDQNIKYSRLDSVEILEQRNIGRCESRNNKNQYVYNLEVKEHHNYFANGVLVSNCKNSKSIRSKAVSQLSKIIPNRILLTGTPILNKTSECWSQLNILSPNTWNSYYMFTERYCNPYKKIIYLRGRRKEVRDISGASNLQELNQRLSTIMIRRLKENVLKELPEKRTSILPVTITNRGEYEQAKKDLFKYLEQTKGTDVAERSLYAEALVKIEVLKQITVRGKMNSILSWLNDFIETEEKLIIFATHRDVINELYQAYEKISVKLMGDSSIRDRQNAIDLFQTNPKIKFIICNIKSGGVGITLTSGSHVLFVEFAWNPAEMEQAESRAYRHGQKNAVNVYHMIGVDTIDTKIHELLANKSKIIKQILESKTNKSIETESIQNELVNSLRQEVKEAE